MFNNQKETDLRNFKTDESLIAFKKKGRFPCSAWYVSTSNSYWHLLVAGSQCNSRNILEICSCLIVPLMRRAAAFCAICGFIIVPTVRPLYKLLQ